MEKPRCKLVGGTERVQRVGRVRRALQDGHDDEAREFVERVRCGRTTRCCNRAGGDVR